MSFQVITALDLFGGRLARFTPAGPEPVSAHDGDPLRAAEALVAAGSPRLHVVDMDLAFGGEQAGLDVLRSIVRLGVPVQAAGAIVDREHAHAVLEAGADRVVLGSAALIDMDEATELIGSMGARLIVGIEVEGDRIRARGRTSTDLGFAEVLDAVVAAGAARLLVTAVERVGTLAGPDLGALALAVGSGVPVIAAGGIASITELSAVKDAGAEGAVVGRAALDGGLDLAEAIAVVSDR
jgi:phosphoribosylformimino-5-aminoimidazole carboxamide ribonucleotide (ProFAR) isomerase